MSEKEDKNICRINATVERETYERLWNYVKKKYISPWRKLSVTINEAIKEYLDRHESEVQEGKEVQ
ncbi:MAG: hypothetical protein QXP52_00165 [Candidatus Aenigmatarchaeota archaeon]